MKYPRQLFALVAVFAVAWGSLWPLVSAARPKSPSIPNFICTQAGFQASHGAPITPGDWLDKVHCPLCVLAVDAALPATAASQSWMPAGDAPRVVPAVPSFHPSFKARPPPSRAPPERS